jgi:hypothetical protein
VRRSQGLPLDVTFKDVSDRAIHYVATILGEVQDRIRSLDIRVACHPGLYAWIQKYAVTAKGSPMLLENLCIEVLEYRNPIDEQSSLSVSDLFSHRLRSLERLRIISHSNLDGLAFGPNLRTLHLEIKRGKSGRCGVDVLSFMHSLRTTPFLEQLVLCDVMPVNDESKVLPSSSSPCPLRHLTFFAMYDTAQNCASFLQLITIPPDTEIELDCDVHSPEDLTALTCAIKTTFRPRHIRSLSISGSVSRQAVILEGCLHPHKSWHVNCADVYNCMGPNFRVRISYDSYPYNMPDILKMLPLLDIETLHIVSTDETDALIFPADGQKDFVEALAMLTTVKRLEMSPCCLEMLSDLEGMRTMLPSLEEMDWIVA